MGPRGQCPELAVLILASRLKPAVLILASRLKPAVLILASRLKVVTSFFEPSQRVPQLSFAQRTLPLLEVKYAIESHKSTIKNMFPVVSKVWVALK